MKIGIVGLPNVGKSTLFNALTKSYAAQAANFPFCTIEANVGLVDVKDPRVDKLTEISQSKNKVYSAIKFVDIAGLVKGASKGEGRGNKFLASIREVDAIVQVVRYFQDEKIIHVDGKIDPYRDIEIINTELILADLEYLDAKLPQLGKRSKMKDPESEKLLPIFQKIKSFLVTGKLAWDIQSELNESEMKIIKSHHLLTFKPIIYLINVSENDLMQSVQIKNEFENNLHKPVSIANAKLESDLISLTEEEKSEYLRGISAGQVELLPSLNDMIKLAFDTVELMYFFTSGEKETRAWTIKKGSTAPQAAGVIHTDFEKGFIKAEVVDYDNFVKYGGLIKSKENGLVRLEGKNYIMQDGDVVLFRFNN